MLSNQAKTDITNAIVRAVDETRLSEAEFMASAMDGKTLFIFGGQAMDLESLNELLQFLQAKVEVLSQAIE